jgi:NTP pyrophosphatase (non-canonical NTP hydrolase)
MTIKELVDQAYQGAFDKGWCEKKIEVPEQVALICSEACEGLEAWRDNQPISWIDDHGKPQGIASEYADILIRVAHYAKILGIDLEKEIVQKLAYNKIRDYRHGGKLA